jgi:hypothetical protein
MSDWKWLESTEELQKKSYNNSPRELTGEEQAEYIRWNVLAAVDELMEFLHEVAWKPWAVGEKGVRNRDAALGELVDVGHFLANLALTVGATDAEWEERYQAKQQKNRDRMASGTYDAVSSKCPACGADYLDSGVWCKPSEMKGDTFVDPWCAKHGGYVTGIQSSNEVHARIPNA